MSKLISMGILSVVLLVSVFTFIVPVNAANGFDEYGYNRKARIFVGTTGGWCAARGWGWDCAGTPWEPYANDHLVMKWNAEWDRGNAEGWSDPNGYAAWENNEWNGAVPGGSGEVWHYKIAWSSVCNAGEEPTDGGYCLWGPFEVIMDHGTWSDHTHEWLAHSLPTGYGAYGP